MVSVWMTRRRRRGCREGWLYLVRWGYGGKTYGERSVGGNLTVARRMLARCEVALNLWDVRAYLVGRMASPRAYRAALGEIVEQAVAGAGPADPVARPAPTWAAFVDEDLAALRTTRGANTVEIAARALKRLQQATGAASAQEIDVPAAERFKQARADAGCAAATIDRDLRTLRAVWNRALKRQRVALNPFGLVDRPRLTQREIRILSQDEERAVLTQCDAARPGLGLFVRFVLDTGVRLGESLHLRWEDVSLTTGAVRIQARDELTAWMQKSGRTRTVTATSSTVALLLAWNRTQTGDYVFGEGKPPTAALRQRWRRRFEKAIKAAGIPAVTIHDLRRTCLTRLALGGMPMVALQRWAGHISPTTTARYYIGLADADLAKAARIARGRAKGWKVTQAGEET